MNRFDQQRRCVAPTGLCSHLPDYPALPGWAKFLRPRCGLASMHWSLFLAVKRTVLGLKPNVTYYQTNQGLRSELVTLVFATLLHAQATLSHFCHPGAQRLNDVSFTYTLSAERRTCAFVLQREAKWQKQNAEVPS